jgi:hypothetical protein
MKKSSKARRSRLAKGKESEGGGEFREGFLLLASIDRESPICGKELSTLVRGVNSQYMARFPEALTRFHVALIGPYDIAVLYEGSQESAAFLAHLILEKSEGRVETVTMPAVDLDRFLEIIE